MRKTAHGSSITVLGGVFLILPQKSAVVRKNKLVRS